MSRCGLITGRREERIRLIIEFRIISVSLRVNDDDRRRKGWVGRFCVLDVFIEMLACEVIGSGSLVGETCRLMEGDDATT